MTSGPRLRPTFARAVDGTPEAVARRLSDGLASAPVETAWAGYHVIVSLPRARRRPWSPWLHADVRSAEELDRDPADGPVVVWCRFSPGPALWTGFMLTLIALLAIALFALALALSQWTLERAQWGWWILVGALALAGAMVAGSLAAQRLAGDEMAELKSVVERAVDGA
jgi:hypothetical protein